MKASIKPQPRNREKPARGKTLQRPIRYLIILLVLLVPAALAFIWLRVQTVHLSYDIASAQKQKKALTEINKKLRIQMANMKSPERIEGIALTQLGLRLPEKGQIEILK
jgi:cell division protein FtsL